MKKYLILLTTCLLGAGGFAQDLSFSQFYELPLLRNPALAGVFNGNIRAQSVYRNQWQSVTVPFRTGGLSLEYNFGSSGEGYGYNTLGVQATYDVAGDSKLSRVQILPVFSKHFNLNGIEGAYATIAAMGGVVSSQFDPSGLKWDDQYQNGSYSPTNPTAQVLKNTNVTYFDQAAGFSANIPFGNYASFYGGLAFYHFLKPSVGFNTNSAVKTYLSPKAVINGGVELPTTDMNRLNVFADYFMQGGHRELMAGALYSMDLRQYDDDGLYKTTLSFGGAYRMNDAFMPLIRLGHNQWSIGMSYDLNVSKLKAASQSRGGFELTLSYHDIPNFNAASARNVKCPQF
jgi:type IX secretion system PorP/SprF family membrane protein